MAKKTTNKKANMAKEENIKDASLETENIENTENTILDVDKKDSDIINEALEGNTSDTNNEDGQKPTTTSEEKVDETKPTDDNAEIDATTLNNKIDEVVRIGKGEDEKLEDVEDDVEDEDSQSDKQDGEDKINTAKHKISKLFGYYWNGQLMD